MAAGDLGTGASGDRAASAGRAEWRFLDPDELRTVGITRSGVAAMTMRPRPRSKTSRRRGPDSIFKNTASSFVAQMVTASLTAGLTLYLVRALGANQYGLFALTIGASSIAIAFADLGLSNSTARFVAEHRGRGVELRSLIVDALKLKTFATGLVCALLAALASLIASGYGNPALVWPLRAIAVATFGQSIYLMLAGIATALGRAVVNVRLVAAESLLEVSATVALVLAGAGAAGAAWGRAIGYVVGAGIAVAVVLRMSGEGPFNFWRLPRSGTVRRVGGYAGSVFAIDASFTLSSSLSVLVVGAYAGAAASGAFQAPFKLITLIQYVGLSAANGVAPRLARGPGQTPNVRAMQGALRGLIGFQCLMLAPAVVWAGPITRVLLGSGYSQSADVLRALAPYIFFSGLAPLVTIGVSYMGEARRRVPIAFATLVLTIGGGLILIPSYGVVGAAIATDIGFGFYTLAHIWLCRRLLELQIGMLLWSLACGLTAAAAMGLVFASIGTEHLTVRDWLEAGAGGVSAYIGMLIFTREIRGAHLIRARATVDELLTRLRPGAWRRTATGAPAAAAEFQATPPADGFSSVELVEPAEVPFAEHDKPRVRERLKRRVGASDSAPRDVRRRRRPRPRIGDRPTQYQTGSEIDDDVRPRRSPAARPPSWVEEQAPEPGGLVEAVSPQPSPPSSKKDASLDEALGPAAQPPAWLSDRNSPHGAGTVRVAAEENRFYLEPADVVDEMANTPRSRAEGLYQIVWRLCDDHAGVFELRPLEPPGRVSPASTALPATEESAPIPWGWAMGPAPMPEARSAHAALVDGLLATGWQRAGVGDPWFAHCFRPPVRPSWDETPPIDT